MHLKNYKYANRNWGVLPNYSSIAIVLVLLTVFSSRAIAFGWEVQGRKIKWTTTAPDGWIGGNYNQIETIMRETRNEVTKALLGMIQRDARSLDVYLLHLDDGIQMSHGLGGFTTRTLTEVRVDLVQDPVHAYLDKEDYRKEIWSASAQLIQADHPQGSHTRMTESRSLTTGGFLAYQAIFVTTRPDRGKVYEVMHIVRLSSKRSHVFSLEVDSAKYRVRYGEFTQMLKSLRYK